MEEIEYLEEYEDLVLPAINSAADAAATTKSSKSVNVDNDGSSSSLDQDIFNCLFDDNSDDDNDEQGQPLKKEQEIFHQKIETGYSLNESNNLLKELGKQLSKECSLEKHTTAIREKDSAKDTKHISSLTSAKIKAVTTVKPTVQQKTQLQKYNTSKQKARHSNTTASNANLKGATSKLNPSTTSSARHTSSFTPTSSSDTNKLNAIQRPKPSFNKQRPATIVKPEKIVTKDPAEDPLNLDDLSSAESANYSVSDISGETYNSISDFDDDDDYDFTSHIDALDDDDDESSNSQVIDISNDSSESRSHFEDLRGSTPSPVVSEDRDLPITSDIIKGSSLPKFMANHEIIKSLLTKGEKPKLLQLINKHDKTDNLGNRGQELESLELSSTTKTKNKDLSTTALVTQTSFLSAHINEENDQGGKSNALSLTQSPETILQVTHLKDMDENKGKSDINVVVKSSKHDSLPNQEVGAEMEIGNEELIEEASNRGVENIQVSRTHEQTTVTEGSKLEKIHQSTIAETTSLDTDKVQTQVTNEDYNDKESTSPQPRKKRFRNLITPELIGLKDDNSIEIISDTKCNEPSIPLDNAGITNNQEGSNYVLKNATVLAVDCKTKLKAERNVSTTKLTSKEQFKSPTKGVDKTNKNISNRGACEKSTDSARDTLNKHIKDVPRAVIMNPFVQRTTKNTFSKDGRAKMSRESSRDNSRESSVESSRSSSRDRYEDNAKTCKLARSEITTNTQHKSRSKDFKDIIKKPDDLQKQASVDTKKIETPKRSNDTIERTCEIKINTNDNKDSSKNKSVAIKDVEPGAKMTTHLPDTKKKDTTKKSIDIEEKKSDIKMTANDNDIKKSIGHVTKVITGSTIKRKGPTDKIYTENPLNSNQGDPGPSNPTEPDAKNTTHLIDAKNKETTKRSFDIEERKSGIKMTANDNVIKKSAGHVTKDITGSTTKNKGATGLKYTDKPSNQTMGDPGHSNFNESDGKNTTHLADTKKKETTKKSIDLEERKSDIKMTPKDNDINKSIGHVTKDISGLTIKRKVTTGKIYTDKPLNPNQSGPGPSNIIEPNAKNTTHLPDIKKKEVAKKSIGIEERKSDIKMTPKDSDTIKSITHVTKDITGSTTKRKGTTGKIYTDKPLNRNSGDPGPSNTIEPDAKNTRHLSDVKKKETTKKSIDIEERKSDIKMSSKDSDINKSTAHVTKDITGSTIKRKGMTGKIYSDKPLNTNQGDPGTSNLNEPDATHVADAKKKDVATKSIDIEERKSDTKITASDKVITKSTGHVTEDITGSTINRKGAMGKICTEKPVNPSIGDPELSNLIDPDAKNSTYLADTQKQETSRKPINIEERKSDIKMTANDTVVEKYTGHVTKDITASTIKTKGTMGKIYTDKLVNPNIGDPESSILIDPDAKNISHLADIQKQENTSKPINIEERISDVKMTANDNVINKSTVHVSKDITDSTIKRKGTTAKVYTGKLLETNLNEPGLSNLIELKQSTSPFKHDNEQLKSDTEHDFPSKGDNIDTKDDKCRKISKDDNSKDKTLVNLHSKTGIAKMSMDITDSSRLCEISNDQKDLKEKSQSSPAGSFESNTKSLTTNNKSSEDVGGEIFKSTTKKTHKSPIKSPVEKDVLANTIANKPSAMQSNTSLTTGTSEPKVLGCEKKKLKESKTAVRSKETSKSLIKEQQESSSHSQDYGHIQSKEKLSTAFPDKVRNSPNRLDELRAEGKSLISKTCANTTNILKCERIEEINTECDGEQKSLVSDIIPQKNVRQPNEEKKHVRPLSTSFGKRSSKDLNIISVKSSSEVSAEKDSTISLGRNILKHPIEQMDADGNSTNVSKSSMDNITDDAGPKNSGNTEIKLFSEDTAKSKKNEKPYSKVENCALFEEENSKVHTEVKEQDNNSEVLSGADQKSISIDIKSRDTSVAAKSTEGNATAVINSGEFNNQSTGELISTISDLGSNLHSNKLKESTEIYSELTKNKDAEMTSSNVLDPMASKTLKVTAVELIEQKEINNENKGKNYKNDDFNITKLEGEVGAKEGIDVQQVEIGTTNFKSVKNTSEISSSLRTIETISVTDTCKNLEIKQDMKDVCRSEEESGAAEIPNLSTTFVDSKDERKQIVNDTIIEVRNEVTCAETNVTVEENINTSQTEERTLLEIEEIDVNMLPKSPALSIRKTRSSKPDEFFIQEETNLLSNPLKAGDTKDVEIRNKYVDTRKSKNSKSEETDLSNIVHEEYKEAHPTEIDKSSDQNAATSLKSVMRKTRSTANSDDVPTYESNTNDDTKLNFSNNTKTNENTIKTPQRNIRKIRGTPSKCEELKEDSKSKELIVSICKNVPLDDIIQFDAIMDNNENDANKSAQKKNRKTRHTLDPKADNTPGFIANKDESIKSKSKFVKQSEPITLGFDSDKNADPNIKETRKITVASIRNENPKTTEDGHKSTDSAFNLPADIIAKDCINEPTSTKRQHVKDDGSKKESKPSPNVEAACAIDEICKNTDKLSPEHSSSDTLFAGKNTSDLLINEVKITNVPTKTDPRKQSDKQVETTINTNLKTSVAKTGRIPASTTEASTSSKCFSDAEGDLSKDSTCHSAERARTLRKRGTPSPFCENRDGANKSLFKTPISVFESCKAEALSAPEVNMKRRLRSPAAEKGPHTPLSKKSKTDFRKARNRNIDVVILGSSESSSDVVAEQYPGSSKETRVLSPRRSLLKQSAPVNEHLSDSTIQAHEIKSNMSKSCELEQTTREPLREDRRSAEKTNQLTSNLIDVDTSSCVNSQCTEGKSNIAFNKDLSDTKEKKTNPGMSKTYPDKEIVNPEQRTSCSILSFAEWLRGNNRNDASQMQSQSIANTTSIPTELSDTGKPVGLLQEFILKNSVETVPDQVTILRSHVSRQISPKRGRKVKSGPTARGADNKETVESVENNSEIKENNSFELQNIPQELVVNTAIEDVPEQTTKPISKKQSQTPPKTDMSPKRGRKVKTMSIVQTATEGDDVVTEKIESHVAAATKVKDTILQICINSEQDKTSPQEEITTQQLNSSLAGESIDSEKIEDFNDNDNLSVSISSPSLKSGRRRSKIRRGRLLVTGTVNKDQQKVKSIHPTRQDKKSNKRTEIDILIESMSKEMKDAGITDLLNNSSNVKRQRAVVKRANTSETACLNPATLVTNETAAKEKIIKDASSTIESAGSSNTAEDISKKSPIRRSLARKLIITKESNKNDINNESLRPMEMEKALIDEVEIRNMNTSLLEPLKCEPTKQHRPSSKLALIATPSLQSSTFKTPKPLTTINRIKSAEDVSQLYCGNDNKNLSDSGRRVSSLKCRMLKIRLNRRVVEKYLQNLRQIDISSTSLNNRTAATQKTRGTTVIPQPTELNEISNVIKAQVIKTTNKDPVEAFKKQQSLITPKPKPTQALPDESNNILYPTTNNARRGNSRNVEEILPDSVMEPMAPIELKNEFLDENPNSLGDTMLPDTPTLIARSHSITQAAASALSNTIMPTDIRLLSNDPMSTRAYVPSFGVTPTLVDARGARMYTFLHPAKYSRNHGNVLLDYCCPNLDGPMPAIDPTRIHAQVQTPVIELPSCIVLTTKVVTRAELESKSSTIPAVIRKKAEKLRSNIHQNLGTPPETEINCVPSQSPGPLQLHSQQITNSIHPQALKSVTKPTHISTAPHFSPAINALAKYLPSTTTITAKTCSPLSQPPLTLPVPNTNQHASSVVSVATKLSPILSETQSNLLRSNLRRVDVLFKSLVQPFEKLNFTERLRIMDSLVASGKFLPKDLERTIVLMEEYLKQINEFQRNQIADASSSNVLPSQISNLAPIRMPPLQPAPKLTSSTFKVDAEQNLEQVHNTAIRKVQSTVKQHNTTVNTTTIKQRQVPIYDTERNIIGYQLQVITPTPTMPAHTKSALSTASGGIMSTSLGASSNQRKSLKRPAQDSPRVFYTSQPMQTSTPKSNSNSMQYSTTPMTLNKNAQTISKSQNGSIVTTVRSAGATTAGTETITTTTMATVKRVTRSRAAGSKIVIVSKSNSNEETILPDVNHQTEIKHEKDVEDFMG